MKKVLIFTLTLILIGSVFVSSIAAVTPYIKPIYSFGAPDRSGWWSPVTFYIEGTFGLWSDYTWFSTPHYVGSPYQIYRDDRDENGDGVCFWILEAYIYNGFAFVPDLSTFYETLVPVFEYQTIQIVLRSYDQEPRGYLNDVNILGADGQKVVLFHTSSGTDPSSDVFLSGSGLFFGTGRFKNYVSNTSWTQSFRQTFMFEYFSGYSSSGGIYNSAGFMKPVYYSFDYVEPSDPSGPSDPSDPFPDLPSDDSSATGGFTGFMKLILSTFSGILNIDFFGGFFSLGDLIGVVVAMALVLLFVKWFAGG